MTVRLTGGPGRDGGAVISGWVRHEAAWWGGWRGADRWGWQHSAPDSVFKLNQIYFKRIQICPKIWSIKQVLSLLQKFQIKYGWKEIEIGDNFTYRNFSRFKIEFELKFKEISMSWISIEIHWKFPELWNLMKFV
jgi:hypothetical protein